MENPPVLMQHPLPNYEFCALTPLPKELMASFSRDELILSEAFVRATKRERFGNRLSLVELATP
jgi:hypothetical protein